MFMRGTFKELSQAEVVQLLIMNRKTGRLVFNENGDRITVFFREGAIIDAEGADAQGEEAFFQPFCWDVGSFEFIPEEIERPQRIESNWQKLLFDASSRVGELDKLRERIGYSFSIPRPTAGFDPTMYDGLELDRQILAGINGRRNIREISRRVGLKVPEVLKRLDSLRDEGLVEIVKTPVTDRMIEILERYIGGAAREFVEREKRRFGHDIELASRDEMGELCGNSEIFALEYTSRAEARALNRELREFVQSLF
ncbi:MAG: DUF4388 domain-containing protein [Candidatus Coatesbacteria bacterium]|nr:DUF4388 domain-containing protein [Candidatus Coatesbacteria bacterium]